MAKLMTKAPKMKPAKFALPVTVPKMRKTAKFLNALGGK
jgi:hypothetical protein